MTEGKEGMTKLKQSRGHIEVGEFEVGFEERAGRALGDEEVAAGFGEIIKLLRNFHIIEAIAFELFEPAFFIKFNGFEAVGGLPNI